METEPLAWIGETASTEWEDEMVARYEELKAARERRRRLLYRIGGWAASGMAFLGFLLLCWAIGRMTPG